MAPVKRKVKTDQEDFLLEGFNHSGKPRRPHRVTVKKPCARRYVEHLGPGTAPRGVELGVFLSESEAASSGKRDTTRGFGKAAIVWLDLRARHASSPAHTPWCNNQCRETPQAKPCLACPNSRGLANSATQNPRTEKQNAGRRYNYLTARIAKADMPQANEDVIVRGDASGRSLHHLISDRFKHLKDLNYDLEYPAAI